MNRRSEPEVEIVIRRTGGLRLVPWRELHAYRDLLWLFVWRDIASRYKQTLIGPLWYIVQPLLTTVVFTVVFGRVAQLSTAGLPPMLFYLCGLLIWSYFAANFTSTAASLANNAGIFGKVYFPRLIVPLSAVLSNLVAFGIQAVVFAGFFAGYKFTAAAPAFALHASAWLFPLVLAQVAALSLGIGLWLAALTARFRDFAVLGAFLVQLWMYATPVIYPLSRVPAKWRLVAALNPMTMPVEITRRMLLGAGDADARLALLSVAITALVLVTGLLVFNRAEKTFVDIL